MQAQLVGWHLEENTCWFRDDDAPPHPERGRVNSVNEARELLEEQARRLSTGGKQVRAFVVDERFRVEPGPS